MRTTLIIACVLALTGCDRIGFEPPAPPTTENNAPDAPLPPPPPNSLVIEWDDADSGRMNGVRFRVANVDAPETGGVGAAIGAALCENEREAGLVAREWAERFTTGAEIFVTREYGFDRMPDPRQLVDISVNGQDYAAAGIAAGQLRSWPHDKTKPLGKKPDWCAGK